MARLSFESRHEVFVRGRSLKIEVGECGTLVAPFTGAFSDTCREGTTF